MSRIYDLTTEKLRRAVGIDVACPRFAWKIASDGENILQREYRITVKDEFGESMWDTGWTESCDTVVFYEGDELEFAADYEWEVSARLSDGETVKAKAVFSTGLMGAAEDLGAKWITLPHNGVYTKADCAAFRKEFTVPEDAVNVKLFVSGSGVYEAYLNGERVYDTDENGEKHVYELKPGFTEPLRRRFYHSYNLTPMCKPGTLCLSAMCGKGWWSDRIGQRGDFQTLLCVLLIEREDGTQDILVSDGSWKASKNIPLTEGSIWDGEDYDARIPVDFMQPGFDDSAWDDAAESDFFSGELEPMHGEPITARADLLRKPEKIYTFRGAKGGKAPSQEGAKDGEAGVIDGVREITGEDFVLYKGETLVIDFAQNAAGREWFRVCGKAGTEITVRHGEMLNDRNGERSRGNDGPGGSVYLENMRSARATTKYIIGCDGKTEEFEPIFTFYGFRYLQITADGDVTFKAIAAKTLTSVGYDSGSVETGDPLVNRLIRNGRWGMYSNYVSIPTDCPQRDERLGWTADTQVFTTTAQYYSTAAQSFLEKWMHDMRDSQDKDGAYPSVAPLGPWILGMGCMGWADAGILVPYYVWRMSGDTTIVEENWFSMKLYMDDFLAKRGTAGPAPCYGDWLSFEPNDQELQVYLGVCYYAWDAMLMSEMAAALGRKDDARRYAEIYGAEKKFFIETYVKEDGTVKLPQQTASLFALKLKLLPDGASYEAVKAQLRANFEDKGFRLQTGFLGTSILLPTLSEYGMNDVAYRLLVQDRMPSWLYSVKAGATTVWERWNSYSLEDGFGDVGMNSFNHYAYGCVTEWMFGYMAGIRPEGAGFRRFRLEPVCDRTVGYCRASYDSVCGEIRSAWEYEGNTIVYTCTVPANTTAVLILPVTGEKKELGSGTYTFRIQEKV